MDVRKRASRRTDVPAPRRRRTESRPDRLRELNDSLEQRVAKRTALLSLLQDVTAAANRAETVSQALRYAVKRVCESGGWCVGHAYTIAPGRTHECVPTDIWYIRPGVEIEDVDAIKAPAFYRRGEGLIGRVAQSGKPEWIDDIRGNPAFLRQAIGEQGLCSAVAVPVMIGREVVSVLEFFSRRLLSRDPETLKTLQEVGTQFGRVVERRRLQEKLVDAVWTQQRSFGQELHDSIGQQMTGIGMTLESLRKKLASDFGSKRRLVEELSEAVQHVKREISRLSRRLCPVDIDAQGLRSSLEELAATTQRSSGVECEFRCDEPAPIEDNNTATHLFRIAQEATNNAVKHAGAQRITIELEAERNAIRLSVLDDGSGIPEDTGPGIGLQTMRYRAGVIGGAFVIARGPRGGTAVTCTINRGGDGGH